MFYLFLSSRVWNTFQWYTFPLPLFNVVALATMFVGTRKRPNNVKGRGGWGLGYLKTPLFRKVSKQFFRRLQVNTAYPKLTRRHTLPSRCINFKDKKSLIARRHVSYRQKHQYRFFFHWGFHEDRFWVHYFFEFTSMICHCLYKILKLIRMPTTLPWGSTIWSSGNACESIQQSLQESLHNANCWFSFNGMKRNVKKQCKS